MKNNILLCGIDYASIVPQMWVTEKNGDLYTVNPKKYDKINYYWRCLNCGNIFSARPLTVTSMIDKGRLRCDKCGKNKHYISYTDSFEANYPEIAKYWVSEKNLLKPSEVACGDNNKYWFYCKVCKKPYQRVLNSIKKNSDSCCVHCLSSYEQSKRLQRGLSIGYDQSLMSLWSSLNNIDPYKVSIKDRASYKWVCPNCREICIQSPDSIIKNGLNCKVCKGFKYKKGFTDIVSVYKNLKIKDVWSTKNKEEPEEVFYGEDSEKFFICERCGKEFSKNIRSLKRETNSVYCAQCKHIIYDLKTKKSFGECRPDLVYQWSKLNKLSCFEVLPSEITKYAWECSQGHIFYRSPHERLERRGECPICSGDEVLVGYNDLATTRPDLVKYWADKNKKYTEVTKVSSYRATWVCPLCGEKYERRVHDRTNSIGCPNCSIKSRSNKEIELSYILETLCKENNLKYYLNYKLFKNRQEVDFYIPSKKLAVEFNGVFWHSEDRLEKDYHYKKWLNAKNLGVSLVFIWEDDWDLKKDIVIKFLKVRLGVSVLEKVNARDCEPYNISLQEAKRFTEENHIQGFIGGSDYICLKDKENKIRAVMILGKEEGIYTIKRYCTDCNLRGGFSKLLNEFHLAYKVNRVITFSDNSLSDGNLYLKNGFIKIKDIPPDYKYLINGVRVHKFNYRKERFKKDNSLIYKDGLTEKELADLNGLVRVWDAGKVKYQKVWE